MILKENVKNINKIVAEYDRNIQIIAATKTQAFETIEELKKFSPNITLGENRVQELLDKYNSKYVWHFIGQLQTNKVKYIIDKVELIHSVDRINLAKEIDKQAKKVNKIQNCLVEINMGNEESKGGIMPENLESFLHDLSIYDNVNIVGLMSVMPNTEDKSELELLYKKLYKLFQSAKSIEQKNVDIKHLSVGMSNDYKLALKYGSNMIRLGREIFGERVYKK